MLCRKLRQFCSKNSSLDAHKHISSSYSGLQWMSQFFSLLNKPSFSTMSSAYRFRLIFRDLAAITLRGFCTRSFLVSTVVKKCRRDRGVREVIQCFRQTFLRPRRTLLLSAAAAYQRSDNDREDVDICEKNITDEELQNLVSDLDLVEELFQQTLYCGRCKKRLVVDKKLSGISYCGCKIPQLPATRQDDSWEPYMEAEDVIIWRREYKKGQGLYAYKIYGRYKEVSAADFAAVQLDIDYRKNWDDAVASLSVVQPDANGVKQQALIHWEVLWPRLFTNRDYVYLRRHAQYTSTGRPQRESIIRSLPGPLGELDARLLQPREDRPSVHSRARRKAYEQELVELKEESALKDNRTFVIMSRSCSTSQVPESKHAIRVKEYWSHMIVRTTNGVDKPGMEFMLTYYDEPSTSGLPTPVASWATGRAAPVYLARWRLAARNYQAFLMRHRPREESKYTWHSQREERQDPPGLTEEQDSDVKQQPVAVPHEPKVESEKTEPQTNERGSEDVEIESNENAKTSYEQSEIIMKTSDPVLIITSSVDGDDTSDEKRKGDEQKSDESSKSDEQSSTGDGEQSKGKSDDVKIPQVDGTIRMDCEREADMSGQSGGGVMQRCRKLQIGITLV